VIQEKQNAVIYGDNSCPMREVQVQIKIKIIQMLHYLPKIFHNEFISQNLCKNLMANESEEISELTD